MSRPLIQKRIDELEAMFEAEHGDADVLAALERELAHRSVPRSATLLAKVRRALGRNPVTLTPTQNVLFEQHSSPSVQVSLLETAAKRLDVQKEEVLPTLPLDDAYKALRLTASASWEEIETSRRGLVDRARPDKIAGLKETQRVSLERDAKLANAAYRALANARVKSLT